MLVICFFEFEVVYSLQGYQDIVHILALSDFTGRFVHPASHLR